MLSANNIKLKVNENDVFSDISVTFLPKSITYLKGPNGSGKTSFLRIMAGLQKPTNGYVTFGRNAIFIKDIAKPYANYLGHDLALKDNLSVYDNIKYWAEHRDATGAILAALNFWDLSDIMDQNLYNLSAGTKKKVALARLMLGSQKIWLLDEAENNLDEANKILLDKLIISKADSGGIILISSHAPVARIKSAGIIEF